MDAEELAIPDNLLQALREGHENPLVVIAAARVLWRFPWRGASLSLARSYFSDCSNRLREEAAKPHFFPRWELRLMLPMMLGSSEQEDRDRAYGVLKRARSHFARVREERALEDAERAGIEEALRFLTAGIGEDAWFSPELVRGIPLGDLSFLVMGGFARTVFEAYDKSLDARYELGNEIVRITWPVQRQLGFEIFTLFMVYQSLFREAQRLWMHWQQEHEGDRLPSFIPSYAGHLSVSWQVAWAASAADPKQLLHFLAKALGTTDERQRLAALNFVELTMRYGYQEEGEPEFTGGTVAHDLPGVDVTGIDSPLGGKSATGSAPPPPPPAPKGAEEAPPVPPAPARRPVPVIPPRPELPTASPGVLTKIKAMVIALIADLIPGTTDAYRIPVPEAAGPPVAMKAPQEPSERYADFTFYRRSNQARPRAKVGRLEPLAMTESYDLEVAVRTAPTGIPMRDQKETRKSIPEPPRGEGVDILVIASSADFDIPEPVRRLRLPPVGNSTENAVFAEVKPRRTTPCADNLAKIRIRLLYNLNLLEHAVIDAEVVSSLEDSPSSMLGLEKTIGLHQDLNFREYRNFELIQPRQMNIFVKGVQGGFELSFTLLREGKPDVVLTGTTRVFETSLEGTLAGIRRTLLGISVWEEFADGIECQDPAKFEAGLRTLAQDGHDLWTKLFGLDLDSALFHIGDWLKQYPLPESSLIQVSIDRSASHFVLPWNLLYDRELGERAPDPKGFWGLRYCIEQETDQEKNKDDRPTVPAQPLEIGFLVSRFREAALQEKFLNEMAGASHGRIAKVVPIDSAKEAFDYLQNRTKQFLLFFAHGHTQFPEAARVGASEADFLTQYEKLPKKSALRKAWNDLYESIKKKKYDSDKSWIKLQHGKLFLLDLYGKIATKFSEEPVVFLNMCESAQLTPSLQESFIHFFLNRGARVVVGTECSMRPLFAHYFAKEMLEGILSGKAIGDVMLEARRNFMQKNNPLGLAYTLFGSPLTRFQPSPLEDQAPAKTITL